MTDKLGKNKLIIIKYGQQKNQSYLNKAIE